MPPPAAIAAAIGSAVSAGAAAVGTGLAAAGAAVGVTGGLASVASGALLVGSATQLVGAVTGSKTLSKIGGFMSMAGGVGSLAGMAGGAAQAAGGAAKAASANSQYGLNMGSKFAAQQGAPIGLLGGGTGNVSMPTMAGMPQLAAGQAAQATQALAPTAGQQGSSPAAGATPTTPASNPLTRAEELLTKYDRTADILGGMADAYMENSAQKAAIKERQKERNFQAEQSQIDRDRAGATIKTQNLRSLLQNTRF